MLINRHLSGLNAQESSLSTPFNVHTAKYTKKKKTHTHIHSVPNPQQSVSEYQRAAQVVNSVGPVDKNFEQSGPAVLRRK